MRALGVFLLVVFFAACSSSPIMNNKKTGQGGGGSDDNKGTVPNETKHTTKCDHKFQTEDLCVSWVWLEGPSYDHLSSLEIKFWKNDADKTPAFPAATFVTEPYMPDHGHGTHGPGDIAIAQDQNKNNIVGTYHVTNIKLTMPGLWEIRLQLKDSDGQMVEQVVFNEDL